MDLEFVVELVGVVLRVGEFEEHAAAAVVLHDQLVTVEIKQFPVTDDGGFHPAVLRDAADAVGEFAHQFRNGQLRTVVGVVRLVELLDVDGGLKILQPGSEGVEPHLSGALVPVVPADGEDLRVFGRFSDGDPCCGIAQRFGFPAYIGNQSDGEIHPLRRGGHVVAAHIQPELHVAGELAHGERFDGFAADDHIDRPEMGVSLLVLADGDGEAAAVVSFAGPDVEPFGVLGERGFDGPVSHVGVHFDLLFSAGFVVGEGCDLLGEADVRIFRMRVVLLAGDAQGARAYEYAGGKAAQAPEIVFCRFHEIVGLR